ncbi:mitochondrial inner membrane protease subunit 1 [Contarinia nasturtii]|uniref:mitochondrial inner membrane protease subunit 1 n=1 Tax=Contarinia nasturtii TaxID=265458 RepID=UPI0012D3CAF5|nr:mitochondrial inner membrane protease subunit 1 [Contarinia nasturtii]
MFKTVPNTKFMFMAMVQAGCIGHCVFEYLANLVTTSGPSMEPAITPNSILLTERISKRLQIYEHGDIVIAKSPIDPEMLVCKRVVGLPGDKIYMKPRISFNPFGTSKSEVKPLFKDDELKDIMPFIDAEEENAFNTDKSKHINNQDSAMRTFRSQVIIVPKGHLWLEGDNSENSIDSRTYGPVPMGLIQSRAAFRLYPDFTVISNNNN